MVVHININNAIRISIILYAISAIGVLGLLSRGFYVYFNVRSHNSGRYDNMFRWRTTPNKNECRYSEFATRPVN